MHVTKSNLKEFRKEFHKGDILAIEVRGYHKPIICEYTSVFTDKKSHCPKARTVCGIDCIGEFENGYQYGVYDNDVRLATPAEKKHLEYWKKASKSHSTEIQAMSLLCKKDLCYDGVGYIWHTPNNISIQIKDRNYDILYIGLYGMGIQIYATEIDEDGCDCNPVFLSWNELPTLVKMHLLQKILR